MVLLNGFLKRGYLKWPFIEAVKVFIHYYLYSSIDFYNNVSLIEVLEVFIK